MEHQQEIDRRHGALGGVATAINAVGSAAVYAYDKTAEAFKGLKYVAKKARIIPRKTLGLATGHGVGKSGEIRRIEEKIESYQKKIRRLYYEIGKEGATHSGDEIALKTEPVKKLIGDVREKEKEIERLKSRIVEIREQKKMEVLRKKQLKTSEAMAGKLDDERNIKVGKMVESAISKAVKHGEFETRSEMEVFDKVANDLLDSEMEVRILATAELGKIANEAAVPILMEASKFDNADLTSEILNSLITIGDSKAIPLFREKVTDPSYRVRIGCLRGLYKLSDDQDAPLLRGALQDAHPEVRRTAATFIGWKDNAEAVPSLVQCLRDEDSRVRKAAVSALANLKDESSVLPLIKVLADKELEIREKALETIKVISGDETIAFDVHASGIALKEAVGDMRDWWEKERLGRVDVTGADVEMEEADMLAAEIAAAEEQDPEKALESGTAEEVVAETAVSQEVVEEIPKEVVEGVAEEVIEEAAEEVVEEAEEVVSAAVETEEKPAETADEDREVDETAQEAAAEGELTYREEQLKRMVKAELLSICETLGIEADEGLLKSEIIELIVGAEV